MHANTHPLTATQRTVRAMRKMASVVARAEIANSHPLATVHTTSPFTIIFDNATVAVAAHYIHGYAPAVNDRVYCQRYGRQIMVLGTFT